MTAKRTLFAGWLVVLAAALVWVPQIGIDTLQSWQAQLNGQFDSNPGLWTGVYFAVFAVLTALCLPGAGLLMLVGAGCMGFGLCTVVSLAASTTGALLTFLFARRFFYQAIATRFGKRLEQVNEGLQRNEVAYLISLRLAPVIPFVLFNVLAGLSKVKPWTFAWTSFIGMLPGTLLYVNAGFELAQVRSINDLLTWEMTAALLALALLPWILQRAVRWAQFQPD